MDSLAGWARHGRASFALAALVPVRRPPILVLGMPRSGTTWVGRTFGAAPNALYLNEPISEVHVAEHKGATFFEIDPANPPETYVWPARFAARGVPAFGPRTLGADSARWRLWNRLGKRVVIKEVNPLALDWFRAELKPDLVYVVRHPAAVALSLAERGWDFPAYEHRFLPASHAELPTDVPDTFWGRIGAVQGVALRRATGLRTVAYEDLCRAPMATYRELYDAVGLRWSVEVEVAVVASTSGAETVGAADPAGTTRNTAAMADAWRDRIDPAALRDVRVGWEATAPDRYVAEDDWRGRP